jgi:hypothetical protein
MARTNTSTGGASTVWNDVTGASDNLFTNNGYITNSSSLVTLTLPAAATVGDTFYVNGKGTGGWLIAQNAGQSIYFGGISTTAGASGSLASTNKNDCVTIVCVATDTDFVVVSSIGNITIS